MKRLIINNADEMGVAAEPDLGKYDAALKVKHKLSVTLALGRDSGESKILEDVADDDVMLLEFENGIRLWTRVDDFEQDFPEIKKRGAASGDLVIPRQLNLAQQLNAGGVNRGIADWVLKTLNIFGVDPVNKTVSVITALVEKQLDQTPGLYHCVSEFDDVIDGTSHLKLKPISEKPSAGQPVLLFIHGTASSSAGSFGELWDPASAKHLKQLQSYFGQHIYAFEHKTLSQSPIENAIDLTKALHDLAEKSGQPLQIHLVTHSRGGLVGELLARVDVGTEEEPIAKPDIENYRRSGKHYKQQAQDLKKLSKLLDTRIHDGNAKGSRKFTIRRFVRTACPARGTTLASERLDRWLSIIMNLIGQIPLLKASPMYDAFSTFTLAVVKQRTKPEEIPGLEAQMPSSPLVRLLNLTNTVVHGDLSVISGDIEPDSFWGRLKLLIPDLYYRDDHDLVVDTRSMTGGTTRPVNNARSYFDQGPGVNHFQYFSNDLTASMLTKGLLRADDDHAGFLPIRETPKLLGIRSERISGDKPLVFVLPGILGSHLQVNRNRIWLDMFDLSLGGLERLTVEAENINAEALVGMAYSDLIGYLQKQHDVLPFPYDWRLSIEAEANRFSIELENKLQSAEQAGQPLHIIAHSMGGLLVRMAFALKPDLWDRMVATQGRFLMLGTPSNGSHVIARLLLGREKMLKYLELLDITNDQKELLQVIAKFSGLIQLLPYQQGSTDLLDASTWRSLSETGADDWVVPDPDLLDQAQRFWEKLKRFKLNHENMIYVAGKAPSTPHDLIIDSDGGNKKIVFRATPKGDGRVTWESGIPSNVRTWFINTGHGNMADYEPAFSGFVDLLQNGVTSNGAISDEPIVDRDQTGQTIKLPDHDRVDLFPDETLMIDSIMGYERSRKAQVKPGQALNIVISQGDLCYASNSLALGHYHEDLIISAESYVNRIFDGLLRRRMLLGLYPGPKNTAQVICNPKPSPAKPEAVLIIGLGTMGNLSRGTLTETFTHAALQYAISIMEKQNREENIGTTEKELKLSSLLIGTGAGGISIEDSLLAMIRGMLNANKQLETMDCCGYRFVELEFLERWEDIVNAAAHAIGVIAEDAALKNAISYEPAMKHQPSKRRPGAKINKKEGARSRVTFQEAEGWWRRIQINHNDADDSLRFNTLTNKARTEITLKAVDLAQVNTFIEQSIQSTYDNPELSKTLFEMLLPHSLKEQTQNHKDLVLVLNEKAARYPWELLQDRWANPNQGGYGQETLPISVEFGMIRQLESETFRSSSAMHGANALVIGNPLGNPEDFPSLQGAENEAKSVYRMLSSRNYEVSTVYGKDRLTDAQKVIMALHADSYRIMHFAGHGVYEFDQFDDSQVCDACGQMLLKQKKITGMVIGENVFLTPANIKSIRFVPDMVFINCCHLGREEGQKKLYNPHQLAANLATEFIRMGVKAVIAAGWAVDDLAAETFAQNFYSLMLSGQRFGDAVRKARRATYKQHKGSNTWGAYQCYGNPDFQLQLHENPGNSRQNDESVSETELAAKIDNIAWDAKISGADIDTLTEKLDGLVKNIPKSWMNAQVQEALAEAYAELGVPQRAVYYYQAVLKQNSSAIRFSTLHQLANQQTRLALARWRNQSQGDELTEINAILDDASKRLEQMQDFDESPDRLNFLGRVYKAKAMVAAKKSERNGALKKMQEFYQQASKKQPKDLYPLYNYLTAATINNWGKDQPDQSILTKIDNVSLSEAEEGNGADFWQLVENADWQVLKHLNKETLTANKQPIITRYTSAKHRAGSPKQLNSIIEHIDFLLHMARKQLKAGKKQTDLVGALTELMHALK